MIFHQLCPLSRWACQLWLLHNYKDTELAKASTTQQAEDLGPGVPALLVKDDAPAEKIEYYH